MRLYKKGEGGRREEGRGGPSEGSLPAPRLMRCARLWLAAAAPAPELRLDISNDRILSDAAQTSEKRWKRGKRGRWAREIGVDGATRGAAPSPQRAKRNARTLSPPRRSCHRHAATVRVDTWAATQIARGHEGTWQGDPRSRYDELTKAPLRLTVPF